MAVDEAHRDLELPPAPPRLCADLRRAATATGRAALGASLAEGWRLVERALVAQQDGIQGRPTGVQLQAVVASRRAATAPKGDEARVLQALVAAGVQVFEADDATVQAVTQGRTFGDVVALVALPRRSVATLLALAAPGAPPRPLLVGVDVLDPGNVGALTRTAYALGALGVVWLGGTDPTHPKALRSSMGASFRLPWAHLPLGRQPPGGPRRSRAEVLTAEGVSLAETFARAGRTNVATVARGGAPLERPLPAGAAVWLGGEAHGLPTALSAACDSRVQVAMRDRVDSLSVNAAAAVVLSRVAARLPS